MATLSPSSYYTPTMTAQAGYSGWRYHIVLSINSTSGNTANINCKVTCDKNTGNASAIRISNASLAINGDTIATRSTTYDPYPSLTDGVVIFNENFTVSGSSFTVKFTGGYYGNADTSCSDTQTVSISGLITYYTVTFDLDGGTRTGGGALTQKIAHGDDATPPTCTRTGYSFDGWSGSYTNVTSNRTITAQWATDTYTITYNANGGAGAPSSQTKTHGQTLVITNSTPTTPKRYTITYNSNGGSISQPSKQVDCEFNSWNTSANGSGTKYNSGSNYTANASDTLYAQWDNPNAGSLPEPSLANAEFTGWFTALHGGTQVTSSTVITSDRTVYARYNYKVQYSSRAYYYPEHDSDPIELEIAEQTKLYDETLVLSDAVPAYDGHTFSGWATSDTSSIIAYNPGDEYTDNAPLHLYGLYDISSYTVTFVNGFGTTLKTQTVSYGESATPPANPTYPNRKFVGWNGDYTNVTSNRTITAMWDATPVWICKINASGKKYWEKML